MSRLHSINSWWWRKTEPMLEALRYAGPVTFHAIFVHILFYMSEQINSSFLFFFIIINVSNKNKKGLKKSKLFHLLFIVILTCYLNSITKATEIKLNTTVLSLHWGTMDPKELHVKEFEYETSTTKTRLVPYSSAISIQIAEVTEI